MTFATAVGIAQGTADLSAEVVGDDAERRERTVEAALDAGLDCLRKDAAPIALPQRRPVADVVLATYSRLGQTELESVKAEAERAGARPLIVVVTHVTRRAAQRAIQVGAAGIVVEHTASATLAPTVRAALAGLICLPRELVSAVSKPMLSTREKQVLSMVVLGFTNGEIARKLYIAETTVKSHLSSAFSKLGVGSRTEATERILDPETGLGTGILAISEPDASVNSTDESY